MENNSNLLRLMCIWLRFASSNGRFIHRGAASSSHGAHFQHFTNSLRRGHSLLLALGRNLAGHCFYRSLQLDLIVLYFFSIRSLALLLRARA